MNQQAIAIQAQIAALQAQLDAILADEQFDAQAHEWVCEELVRLQDEQEALLAGLLQERWTAQFKTPMTYAQALELARTTIAQRRAA